VGAGFATLVTPALVLAVQTEATASAFFARVLDPAVQTDATASAFFALVLSPAVQTAATTSAFFARVLDPAVQTEATASAFFARVLVLAVQTDATASAFFALVLSPAVQTEATTSAFFVSPAMLARRSLAVGSVASSNLSWFGIPGVMSLALRPASLAPHLMRDVLAIEVPLLAAQARALASTCSLRFSARPARFRHMESLRLFAATNIRILFRLTKVVFQHNSALIIFSNDRHPES
jgi:hypothetical protein